MNANHHAVQLEALGATQFEDLGELDSHRETVAMLSKFVPLIESLLSLMAEKPVGRSQHTTNRCGLQMVKSRLDELLAVAQVDPRVCAALGRSC